MWLCLYMLLLSLANGEFCRKNENREVGSEMVIKREGLGV